MLSVALVNIALYIFLCCISTNKVESCGYTFQTAHLTISKIDPLPSGVSPRSGNNLIIHYEYTDSFNNYGRAADIKRDLLEPARLSLQSMITVKNPTSGILRVDRDCVATRIVDSTTKDRWCSGDCAATTTCMGIVIPDKYLKKCQKGSTSAVTSTTGSDGAGENNVDIVLFVSYVQCSSGVIASATTCFIENTLDRPTLGVLNLCSGMINAGMNIRENTMAIKHQIVHALGFAVDKYAYYRNQDGTPIVPRDGNGRPNAGQSVNGYLIFNDKIAINVKRDRSAVSKQFTSAFLALVLPNVVAVAREHFNCPSITSVDLEDMGTAGSAFSHFDELFLYNECMTSENNGWNDRLSKFTLALLKDTGWYGVDYSKADDLLYGKNAGCIMPLKGCYAYMESQRNLNLPLDPFCNTASGSILQCNPTRQYYEYCNIIRYSSVDTEFRYFTSLNGLANYDETKYAGSSLLSEYCPMKSVPYSTSDGLNSDCSDASNNGKSNKYTPLKSGYGSNSMCFDTTMSDQSIYGASCSNYSYTGNNAAYKVCGDGQKLTCTGNEIKEFYNSNRVLSKLTCVQQSSLATNNDNGYICLGNQLHQWSLTLVVIALASKLFDL